ncbi:MAG: hypothetical protein IJ685_06610 [Selenomonadaceae bacterium]|nr:hypothetical protein [Selenomonadaceae bacterium]
MKYMAGKETAATFPNFYEDRGATTKNCHQTKIFERSPHEIKFSRRDALR